MKALLVVLLVISTPRPSVAAIIDLAMTTCAQYQTRVLGPAGATAGIDPIDTVMGLFGYSVAVSGNHVMFSGALSAFGFALDAECKTTPTQLLRDAMKAVTPKRDEPMDLTTVSCATFEKRHRDLATKDADSAKTLLTWLYGFSLARSGGHLFDTNGVQRFSTVLATYCAASPQATIFDAASALKPS